VRGPGDAIVRFELTPAGRFALEDAKELEQLDELHEPDVNDEPPPDFGPPGSGAVVVEYDDEPRSCYAELSRRSFEDNARDQGIL
jgi:hypothetical protein